MHLSILSTTAPMMRWAEILTGGVVMRLGSITVDHYRPPPSGLPRVRWFLLCFTIFTIVTVPIQAPVSSPVSPQWWVGGVLALGYLIWRRLYEYRVGKMQRPFWDLIECIVLFVALVIFGPLQAGASLIYSGVYFRNAFGSTRRVVLGSLAYVLVMCASSWYADRLSPAASGVWKQQVVANVIGVAFSAVLMRLILTTLLVHQSAMAEERRLLTAVLDNVGSAVIATDNDGVPTVMNRAAHALHEDLKLPPPPAPWNRTVTVYRADASTPLRPQELPMDQILRGKRVRNSEFVIGLADGTQRFYVANGQPLTADATPHAGAVLTVTDVTEHKRAEQRLSDLALHDPLTGLTNRVLLRDRLEHALQRRSSAGRPVHLLYLDLDGFKTVNDSLGHHVGDQVLVIVADRLRTVVRTEDTVARLGGDEFAVLIEQEPDQVALPTARRILDALQEPVVVQERAVTITASIGIASSDLVDDADELLRNADLAMYAAKTRGNRVEPYDPAMHESAVQRLVLEADLRMALQNHELHLQYQPVVSLATERMIGVEALLRWRHPRLGEIPPLDFIPLAESCGLIVPIGAWVIGEATRQLRRWNDTAPGSDGLTVAVNVAVSQLERPELVDEVRNALRENGVAPEHLVVEITESAMSEHIEVLTTLRALRRMGVALAVDDFGTGYSSLSRLRLFPIQKVKIDRSFVTEIRHADEPAILVTATLGLAHGLGMQTVAEGVETPEQLEFLRRHGCAEAQGYYFNRPLDPDGIAALLRDHPDADVGLAATREGRRRLPTDAADQLRSSTS